MTFLLTDVEGSTALWERDESGMAQALAFHDALIERSVTAHGGQFLKARGEGDATFSVFDRPSDAVTAAVVLQHGLREAAWPTGVALRVRVALHTGEAEARDGDYFGPTVNRCARLRAIAHGGQTICSQATEELIVDHLASDVSLRDLGLHKLRDLDRSEHVFQIGGENESFPQLRSLDAAGVSLPAPRTTFIGRADEVAAVEKHLEHHRLVTLTGVGGVGKTRLALEVAHRVAAAFVDGVTFVDLSPVSDPDGVGPAVANAAKISLSGGDAGRDIVAAFDRLERLLVFDTCEHQIDAIVELIEALLDECPNVRVLATSREALEVNGEQLHTVRSLTVRSDDDDPGQSEAVRLFCDRAAQVRDGFVLDSVNRAAIVEICRRLDGMPLAIELAAGQMTHLTPAQIVAELDSRLTALTGGRGRVARQKTLAATLDWSYELLSDEERILLRRLAVFSGSFSLEAVASICMNGLTVGASTGIHALVSKSLVVLDASEMTARYRLLDTVRFYAEQRLLDAAEAELLRDRHRDHYVAWVEGLPVDAQLTGDQLMLPELHNLRAALEWSAAQGRRDLVARQAGRMAVVWDLVDFAEGLRWLDIGRKALEDVDLEVRINVLGTRCFIEIAGLVESEEARLAGYHELIALAGDCPGLWPAAVYSLLTLTQTRAAFEGEDVRGKIEDYGQTALRLATTPAARMFALTWIGHARVACGDLDAGIEATEQALRIGRDLDAGNWTGYQYAILSLLHHLQGDFEQARSEADAAADPAQMSRQYNTALYVSLPFALATAVDGAHDDALEVIRDAVRVAPPVLTGGTLPCTVNILAALATLRNDLPQAAVLLGAATALFTQGIVRSPIDVALAFAYGHRIANGLGDEFNDLFARGLNTPIDEALSYGLGSRKP